MVVAAVVVVVATEEVIGAATVEEVEVAGDGEAVAVVVESAVL